MNKPIIIFLEGVDKVGKSTIRRLLHQKPNDKYFIIERSPASMYVYGKIFGSQVNIKYLLSVEKNFSLVFNVKPAYLYAPAEILIKRLRNSNDPYKKIYSKHHLEMALKYFDIWIKDFSLWNWYTFKTYNKTPEETVKEIREVFKI